MLCEASKKVLLAGASELVNDMCGLPILTTKSCDGTPLRVTSRQSRKLGDGEVVRSMGQEWP